MTTADELLRACVAAASEGADFPAVWSTILRGHQFVAGLPIQTVMDDTPILRVPLFSGEFILVGPAPGDYRLSR